MKAINVGAKKTRLFLRGFMWVIVVPSLLRARLPLLGVEVADHTGDRL